MYRYVKPLKWAPSLIKYTDGQSLDILDAEPPENGQSCTVFVVYEEPSDFDHLRCFEVDLLQVPFTFNPAKAKYKARGLQYFGQSMKLDENDWVFHLDEETLVDEYAILACWVSSSGMFRITIFR